MSTGKDHALNSWRSPYGASIFHVCSLLFLPKFGQSYFNRDKYNGVGNSIAVKGLVTTFAATDILIFTY